MKKLVSGLIWITLLCKGFAQDYRKQFEQQLNAGDTIAQWKLLTQWEAADPENPELFTSYFNYYFQKAGQEVVSLSAEEPDGEAFRLQDSTGQVAGYIGSEIIYNRQTLQKGLDKIDQGISLYPNRLDMRFGKIYVLGQLEEWEQFTDEIIRAIRYSAVNQNQWTWTNNEVQEDGESFFLGSLQDYQINLYETGEDNLLTNMRNIADEILKIYPTHIESLSNKAITYIVTEEYDAGIEILLKAEHVDPSDAVVLSNIAQAYRLKGDVEHAIQYYEKMLLLADAQAVQFAKQQIDALQED